MGVMEETESLFLTQKVGSLGAHGTKGLGWEGLLSK